MCRPSQASERYIPLLRAMEEVFYGSIWYTIGPLLTTDDAVKSRTVTSRWNVVNRYGALGDFYFMMLQSDQYEKQSDYDSDGNQVYTMSRKRNPIMDSFRRKGLHLSEEKTSSNTQKGEDMASLGDTVMALTGYQVAEARLHQANSIWDLPEVADNNDTDSIGSICLLTWADQTGNVTWNWTLQKRRRGGWRKYGRPPSHK